MIVRLLVALYMALFVLAAPAPQTLGKPTRTVIYDDDKPKVTTWREKTVVIMDQNASGNWKQQRVAGSSLGQWKGIMLFVGQSTAGNGYLFDPVGNQCVDFPSFLDNQVGVALVKGKCCSIYASPTCRGEAYGEMCASIDQMRDTYFSLPLNVGWSAMACRDAF